MYMSLAPAAILRFIGGNRGRSGGGQMDNHISHWGNSGCYSGIVKRETRGWESHAADRTAFNLCGPRAQFGSLSRILRFSTNSFQRRLQESIGLDRLRDSKQFAMIPHTE